MRLSPLRSLRNISVFRKLTLFFTAVVVATAALISIPLFQVFSYQYNKRVTEMNRRMLEQYASVVTESVITPIRKAYLDLCLNINHKTDINLLFAPEYNSSKIYSLQREITTFINSSGSLIEAIHIYTGVHDFVVSSVLGLKYNHQTNRQVWPEISLFSGSAQLEGFSRWTGAREIRYTTTHSAVVVTFIGSYPSSLALPDAKGCICIDVKVGEIQAVLGKVDQKRSGELLIFGSDGNLIAYSGRPPDDGQAVTAQDLGYAPSDLYERINGQDRVINVGGVRALVSCRALDNGWMLANVIPIDEFYSATRTLAIWTYGITAVAGALCILLASRFVRGVASPMKTIIKRARRFMSQAEGAAAGDNEFALIDSALTELYARIDDLSQTWADSLPAIKQNLLRSLISQTCPSVQVFARQIHNFSRRPAEGRFCFLIANLLDCEDASVNLEIINGALVRYIEDLSDSATLFVAGELSAQCIGALVIAGGGSQERLQESLLTGIVAYARRSLGVDVTLYAGSWQDNPLDSHRSYKDAQEAGRQCFFRPWQSVFIAESVPDSADDAQSNQANEDARAELERCVAQFQRALPYGEGDAISAIIQNFSQSVRIAPLCCDDKHDYLARMAATLGEYARQAGFSDVVAVRYPAESVTDIDEYEAWLNKTAELICAWKLEDGDVRARDTIADIKQYIAANLGKDLSLTSLSEYTALSNSYISHIFKEKTGIGLIDYITQERMSRARELLAGTTQNIESIARQLGFHTPHYFAKRFRQYYGVSPHQYRSGDTVK